MDLLDSVFVLIVVIVSRPMLVAMMAFNVIMPIHKTTVILILSILFCSSYHGIKIDLSEDTEAFTSKLRQYLLSNTTEIMLKLQC